MVPSTTKIPQAMQPHGLAGRVFGSLMERINRPAYGRAAELIELPPDGAFLELGFGTGRLIEMMAGRLPQGFVAGIDASALMVETARKRLKTAGVRHDIRQGAAEMLPWPDASFDAAAALHCFQFWPDPVQVLAGVHRTLRPGGAFVFVLRDHGHRDADWLPNPWSRGAGEVDNALELLRRTGFTAGRILPDAGTSPVIAAHRG